MASEGTSSTAGRAQQSRGQLGQGCTYRVPTCPQGSSRTAGTPQHRCPRGWLAGTSLKGPQVYILRNLGAGGTSAQEQHQRGIFARETCKGHVSLAHYQVNGFCTEEADTCHRPRPCLRTSRQRGGAMGTTPEGSELLTGTCTHTHASVATGYLSHTHVWFLPALNEAQACEPRARRSVSASHRHGPKGLQLRGSQQNWPSRELTGE